MPILIFKQWMLVNRSRPGTCEKADIDDEIYFAL